jgi:hypothetical protein
VSRNCFPLPLPPDNFSLRRVTLENEGLKKRVHELDPATTPGMGLGESLGDRRVGQRGNGV